MSNVFQGSVMLPGDQGPGLDASVEMLDDEVRMYAGEEELGTWEPSDFDVSPSGKGSFRLNLAGELVFFTPSSPSKFAEAMSVPLQSDVPPQSDEQLHSDEPLHSDVPPHSDEPQAEDKPKYDIDAAIDEVIAAVKPLKSVNDEDDILSKPLLATIVVVSGSLMAGMAGMAFML